MSNTYSASLVCLWELVFGAGGLGTLKPSLSFQKGLSQGAGSWQFNKLYIQERTVVTGAPDTLLLTDGSLKDPALVGNVFTKVMAWAIINEDLTVNALTVGGAASHPWEAWTSAGGLKHIHAGGCFYDASKTGYAVGAGATDQIKIAADTGTITYGILILGQG